ncbi:MAG: hypothetical protein V4713_12260, partial [Pseudomonadota bacterium]
SARSKMASKEKRLYVRGPDGALLHKQGTLHTAKDLESYPYYLISEGKGKSRSFSMFDAMTGQLMKEGFESKTTAHEFVNAFLSRELGQERWLEMREQSRPIGSDEIDDYRNEHALDKNGDAADVEISLQDVEGVTGHAGFSIYDDMKAKLMAAGVPEHEIEFIHDHDTPQAKHQLFKRVNAGEVRYFFGSTPRMGAGTNVQERIVGLHNIDAPYRPSDLEQREGRGIRRGNKLYERDPQGFELFVFRYATAQTYDTRRWQIVEHKAAGIEQLRNYSGINEMDDVVSEASNSADMKAASSGNPLILKETQLSNEVKRLRLLERAHLDGQFTLQSRMRSNQKFVDVYGPKRLEQVQTLVAQRDSATSIASFNGRPLLDKEEIMETIDEIGASLRVSNSTKILVYKGLQFTFRALGDGKDFEMTLPDGEKKYLEVISRSGLVTRMENFGAGLDQQLSKCQAYIEEARTEVNQLKGEIGKPFSQLSTLQSAIAEHGKVQRALRKSTSLAAVKPHEMMTFMGAVATQKRKLRAMGFDEAVDEIEMEEKQAVNLSAMVIEEATPADLDAGEYCGKILAVHEGTLIQKTGRGGQTIRHELSRLQGNFKTGEVITIRYSKGKGQILEIEPVMERD